MFTKEIKFTDFNGNPQSVVAFFHLSKAELIYLQLTKEGGFVEYVQNIVEAKDESALVATFKNLIDFSYGSKSSDGQYFEKSEEILKRFKSSPAYSELFMELATDDNGAAAFINGVIPNDLKQGELPQDKPSGPPPAPITAEVVTPSAPTQPVQFGQL